jgi:hypothetical protein
MTPEIITGREMAAMLNPVIQAIYGSCRVVVISSFTEWLNESLAIGRTGDLYEQYTAWRADRIRTARERGDIPKSQLPCKAERRLARK